MTELKRKVVLITGATGGFGQHMTQQFLAAGSHLVLTDVDSGRLNALKDQFTDSAKEIIAAVPADLSTSDGCEQLYGFCQSANINPDVLANNAGIAVAGRHDLVPADRWETLMQLNLLGPMRLCYLFLPRMIERGSGHIINISSLAGWVGSPGLGSYSASKFGLRGFSESLAAELEEQGIKVSTVYPCFSRTPILDSDQFGYEQRRAVPEQYISEPGDVVAQIIKGVKKNREHIFPDKTAQQVHLLKRFFPWIMPMLERRMEQQSIEEGAHG